MCVAKDDFKKELEKNGLKYGYIKRLYEKFKQDNMIVFRILIDGIPYTVVTDNESSYPEIQEETGKKVEPYSFEWLVDTVYNAELAGPVSYEVLLRQLQRYIQFQKARQNDEKKRTGKLSVLPQHRWAWNRLFRMQQQECGRKNRT